MNIRSKVVQIGREVENDTKAVTPPLSFSTTFERGTDGNYPAGFRYIRSDNPTRNRLEKSLASLENGEYAISFSSGMGAITAVFDQLASGEHVILPNDLYHGVRDYVLRKFKKINIEASFIDQTNLEEVLKTIQSNTTLIWMESPSNPLLNIVDINEMAKIGKENNVLIGIDNTWATPIIQNPLDLGVDIVMHSTTKYIGGHSDLQGGVLITNNSKIEEELRMTQKLSGAVPSPFDCWLTLRSLPTLPLRVAYQSKSAKIIAEFLQDHSKIMQVNYPGLKSHRQHNIAKKQMHGGYSGMMSFLVKGTENDALKVANSTNLITQATSLGGVESLIEHRRSVEGPNSSTPENLLRLSVGIEGTDDLIIDLDNALRKL